MTPEQQFMWDCLSGKYSKLSHDMGIALVNTDKRWLIRRANKFLLIVNTWPIEDCVRALCTWLTTYNLPLAPGKMSNFDTFHERCGNWIVANKQKIQPFKLGE